MAISAEEVMNKERREYLEQELELGNAVIVDGRK
jgi:hypothetical protein